MKYEKMNIEEFVQATHTFRLGDKVGTTSVRKSDAPAYAAYVKAHKPEILSFLIEKEEAEKKAAADRQAKIDAIEGLKELEAANEALLNYREAFNRAIENDDAIFPSKPSVTPEGIEACGRNTPAPQHTARLKPVRLPPTMFRRAHTRRLWSASSMVMTTRRPLQMQTLNGKRILTSTSGTEKNSSREAAGRQPPGSFLFGFCKGFLPFKIRSGAKSGARG